MSVGIREVKSPLEKDSMAFRSWRRKGSPSVRCMFGVWTEGDEGWADTEVLLDDCMEAPELDERVDIAERKSRQTLANPIRRERACEGCGPPGTARRTPYLDPDSIQPLVRQM
jgi:hypothetical protein